MAGTRAVDVVDETFVVADRAEIVREVCDEAAWARLGHRLECYEDRGLDGRRWSLDGELHGTCEIWLEPWADGTLVHLFVQADPHRGSRRWEHVERRWVRPLRQWLLDVKIRHDLDRAAGTPRRAEGGSTMRPDPDEEA